MSLVRFLQQCPPVTMSRVSLSDKMGAVDAAHYHVVHACVCDLSGDLTTWRVCFLLRQKEMQISTSYCDRMLI